MLCAPIPRASADECDKDTIPQDQFEDFGYKGPKEKKPPHKLKSPPTCEGCKAAYDEVVKALDECAKKVGEANKELKRITGAGTGSAMEDGRIEKAAREKIKTAKADVKKKWEEYQNQKKQCPNAPPQPETPTPTPTPEAPPRSGVGTEVLPTLPPGDCWKSEKEKKKFYKDLDAVDEELQADEEAIGKFRGGAGAAAVAAKKKEAKALREAANNKKWPCPPPGGGQLPVPPGGGGNEQKSMLPPGPGQEQKSMAPGQPPPADETSGGCKVKTTETAGLVTKETTVIVDGKLIGTVDVNLPNEAEEGAPPVIPMGSCTGTVTTDPAGKNEAERASNQTKLNELVLVVAGQQVNPAAKTFTWTNAAEAASQPLSVEVFHQKKRLVKTSVTVSKVAPERALGSPQCPEQLQMGRNFFIPYPGCDGIASPADYTTVGGQNCPLVAESWHGREVRDMSNVAGPVDVKICEQNKVSSAVARNLGVEISATDTNLKPNQTTSVEVRALGLLGITESVGLDIVDKSPRVLKLSGGDTQHFDIQPSEVGPDGSVHKKLTGRAGQPGKFEIDATFTQKR